MCDCMHHIQKGNDAKKMTLMDLKAKLVDICLVLKDKVPFNK